MTYAELVTHINAIAVDSFSTTMVNMFIQQAEEKIYTSVPNLPVCRKESTSIATVNGTATITLPTDFRYMRSFAVLTAANIHKPLIKVDDSFIDDAFPVTATTAFPQYYALINSATLRMGPTPNAAYSTKLRYGFYPTSIVTESTTWLGDNFSASLLNGSLIEAARAQKAEEDVITEYEKLYVQSMGLLAKYADGRAETDTYHTGGR